MLDWQRWVGQLGILSYQIVRSCALCGARCTGYFVWTWCAPVTEIPSLNNELFFIHIRVKEKINEKRRMYVLLILCKEIDHIEIQKYSANIF